MRNKKQTGLIPDIKSFNSLSGILENISNIYPENIFLIENNNKWTYEEYNGLVNACCNYFTEIGLEKNDCISLVLKNSIDFLIVYFASLRSGIVVNPFPVHVASEEIISKIEIVKPNAIFSHSQHFRSLKNCHPCVYNLDNLDGKTFFEYLQGFSLTHQNQQIKINNDEIAALYYSSGTTGEPKIVEYPHRSMIENQAAMFQAGCAEANAVHICFLPLGHTAALNNSVFHCICTGSTVVMYESFWKVRADLWNIIYKYKATYMVVVPSILIAIMNTPYKNFSKNKVKSIKFIGCGSAFLDHNLQDEFETKFGIPVANLYGSTETGATHFDNPFEPNRKTGNIGRPLDSVKIKILDENQEEVQNDEIGEICVNSPALLKGYFKNNTSFKACFNDYYFMTGDIGYKDNNDIYYYVDRKKDMIIKGGVNILPSHIDDVLQSHKSVEEVATIGIPDMFFGESIKSYIVLNKGEKLDSKALISYCREILGDFKTPSEIEYLDEIPKGPSGKIMKRKLRERNSYGK